MALRSWKKMNVIDWIVRFFDMEMENADTESD